MEKGTDHDGVGTARQATLAYARPPRSSPLRPTTFLANLAVGAACLVCGLACWAFGGLIVLTVYGTGRTSIESIEGTVVAVVALACTVPMGCLALCFAGRHLFVRPRQAIRRARSAVR